MSQYYLVNGYNETGKSITLEVGWEHKKSELRCLCVVDDKENQEFRVLNAGSIAGSGGKYTIMYPFANPGLPWRAYLWRDTTRDRTITFDGGAIPVTAILAKITELSDKSDEAKVLLERVLMAPEDADGKLFIPPVNVRKGEVLGFDDIGRPVTGKECKQVKELYDIQDECKKYVSQAKGYADQANTSMLNADGYSEDAHESAKEAEAEAEEAKKYALESQGWTQKVADTAEKGIAEINKVAREFNQEVDGKLKDAVSLVDEDARNAEEDANRAQEAYEALSELKDKYNDTLCYIACAAKKTEHNKNKIEELLAENADGLNKLDNAVMRDGDTITNALLVDCAAPVARSVVNTHTDNALFYAYVGTLANIGIAEAKAVPKAMSLYRRSSAAEVDSDVPRYLRILRKNDAGAWYVAYQSTNGLAPLSFTNIGDEMKWTMGHVAGDEWIPTSEEIAIVQTDRPASLPTEFVRWGARTTPAYGGGLSTEDLSGAVSSFAPAISVDYEASVALATIEDVGGNPGRIEALEQEIERKVNKSTLESGFKTQTIFGYDAVNEDMTGVSLYLDGSTFAVTDANGNMITFPTGAGTVALTSDIPTSTINNALSKTVTTMQSVAGEVSFTKGIRVSTLKSTAGSAIYDTTDSKGFNFRGIYRLFGYDIANPTVGVQFFEQVSASENWIDVTTLKLSGTDITTMFVLKADYDAATERLAAAEAALTALTERVAALEAQLGGMSITSMTQTEYDALTTKDANTLYVING